MHFSISTWLFTSLVHTFNSFRSSLYLIASRVFTLEAEPVTSWVQKPRVVVGAFQAGVQSEIKPSIQFDTLLLLSNPWLVLAKSAKSLFMPSRRCQRFPTAILFPQSACLNFGIKAVSDLSWNACIVGHCCNQRDFSLILLTSRPHGMPKHLQMMCLSIKEKRDCSTSFSEQLMAS